MNTPRVIARNEAIQMICSLDCFVVPPRNDAKRRQGKPSAIQRRAFTINNLNRKSVQGL